MKSCDIIKNIIQLVWANKLTYIKPQNHQRVNRRTIIQNVLRLHASHSTLQDLWWSYTYRLGCVSYWCRECTSFSYETSSSLSSVYGQEGKVGCPCVAFSLRSCPLKQSGNCFQPWSKITFRTWLMLLSVILNIGVSHIMSSYPQIQIQLLYLYHQYLPLLLLICRYSISVVGRYATSQWAQSPARHCYYHLMQQNCTSIYELSL